MSQIRAEMEVSASRMAMTSTVSVQKDSEDASVTSVNAPLLYQSLLSLVGVHIPLTFTHPVKLPPQMLNSKF